MGISCSCRAKSDKVIDVYQYDATFATVNFSSKSEEIAAKDLAKYFEEERANIPYKLMFYYVKVFEASCQYEKAIIVKVSKIGSVGLPYLIKLLPYYTHIEQLHLWKVALPTESIRLLTDSLYLVPRLKSLNLEDNKLRDEALLCLCRTFPMVVNLEELWLSANEFSASGVRMLAEGLAKLPKLKTLGLSYNYLKDEGCEKLCQRLVSIPPLSVLELAGNNLTDASTTSLLLLAQTCHPIVTCDLRGNTFSTDGCEKLKNAFKEEVLKVSE